MPNVADTSKVPEAITIALVNDESPSLPARSPPPILPASPYRYNLLLTLRAVTPFIFNPLIVFTTPSSVLFGAPATVTVVPLIVKFPVIVAATDVAPLIVGQLAAHAWLPTNTQSPELTAVPPPAMLPLPGDL